MSLADVNFNELKQRVKDAYDKEDPIMKKFRDYAKKLIPDVKKIRPYEVNAVSFVSTDGGDNRLFFNPAVIELVRVVDSRGNQCALDAIASNSKSKDLNERTDVKSSLLVPPLKKLCDDLGKSVVELSYLLKSIDDPGKSTGAIRTYRDIVEWAVLYELICDESLRWGGDTILVRDGLLRTKSFRRDVFPTIDRNIRNGVASHKIKNVQLSLVGVAKQSAVLSRLAVALELEEVFHKPFPCFVKVPSEIEEACYNFDRTWLDTYESITESNESRKPGDKEKDLIYQAMGQLYLVKFGDRRFDPVWPVDIAEFQIDKVEKTLGQLTFDAQLGFPIPDYPMCIQKAHDFAQVNGLELSVLQDVLFNGMISGMSGTEKEKVLRIKHLGENLANLRYKNG